ncbi:MAG: hypothetical protein WBB19_01990 [Desulforhopalus sp.]
MESRTTSRHNVKQVYWQQQIRNWKTSGLSQKQFCRRESLALSTFSYWKRRTEILEAEKIKFYPLSIPPSITPPVDSGLLLLINKKKFAIELKEEFSPTALKKLISALEQS